MDLDLVYKQAKELAKKHLQRPYGLATWLQHLQRTEDVLVQFGYGPKTVDGQKLLVLAWAHDLLEGTELSVKELDQAIGTELSKTVQALTLNSKRSRLDSLENFVKVLADNPLAVILKQATRISHLEEARRKINSLNDKKHLRALQKEAKVFAKLKDLGGDELMWVFIDELTNTADYQPV